MLKYCLDIFAWGQRRLGDMAEFSKGSGYSKGDLTSYGTPIILYGRLYTKYETVIDEVDTFVEMKEKSVISNGGEVVVPSSGESAEDISRASVVGRAGVILGGDLNIIKPNVLLCPPFLAITISNGNQQKELSKRAQGKSVVHIGNTDLKEVVLQLPNINEQTSICEFFSSLDNAVNLHKRKLDKLKDLKKGYLQLMFPQNGENVPRVRFTGFNGEWKLTTIGRIAEVVRGSSPRPIQDPIWFDENSDVGWLRISDVTEQEGRIYHLEQKISSAGQAKTRVLTEPHLLLSIAATVGKPVINYVKTGVHDGFLVFLKPKFEQEFMFQWFEMFRPLWQKYGQPGSQVNLNSDLVKAQEILLPSEKEQIAIGNFFVSIDKQIATHRIKLDKIKCLKSAYLQKMFI